MSALEGIKYLSEWSSVSSKDDPDGDRWYEAVQAVERAVEAELGEDVDGLQDWIGGGSYDGTETVESIAAEWRSIQ